MPPRVKPPSQEELDKLGLTVTQWKKERKQKREKERRNDPVKRKRDMDMQNINYKKTKLLNLKANLLKDSNDVKVVNKTVELEQEIKEMQSLLKDKNPHIEKKEEKDAQYKILIDQIKDIKAIMQSHFEKDEKKEKFEKNDMNTKLSLLRDAKKLEALK
jgi:hypothetical protein